MTELRKGGSVINAGPGKFGKDGQSWQLIILSKLMLSVEEKRSILPLNNSNISAVKRFTLVTKGVQVLPSQLIV
jgi:hypothetical protein